MSIQLKMQTDSSNIQMEKVDPKMQISGQESKMVLNNDKGDFKIRQKADVVEIHNYNAYKQLNGYNLQDLMKREKSESEQKTSQAIANYAAEGEALMKIENGGNPLIQIGKNHGNTVGKTNLNIENFPKEPIEVDVKKGYIDVQANSDKISTKVYSNLRIDVQPGGVYTKIDRAPKVNIEAVGELLDSKV